MTSLETDVMPIPEGVTTKDAKFQSRSSTGTDAPVIESDVVTLPESESSESTTETKPCGCDDEKDKAVVIDPAKIQLEVEKIEIEVVKTMEEPAKKVSEVKMEPKVDINVALLDATETRKKENVEKLLKKVASETVVPEVAKAVDTITKNVSETAVIVEKIHQLKKEEKTLEIQKEKIDIELKTEVEGLEDLKKEMKTTSESNKAVVALKLDEQVKVVKEIMKEKKVVDVKKDIAVEDLKELATNKVQKEQKLKKELEVIKIASDSPELEEVVDRASKDVDIILDATADIKDTCICDFNNSYTQLGALTSMTVDNKDYCVGFVSYKNGADTFLGAAKCESLSTSCEDVKFDIKSSTCELIPLDMSSSTLKDIFMK